MSKLSVIRKLKRSNSFYPSRYYYNVVLNRYNNGNFYGRLLRDIKGLEEISTSTKINLLEKINSISNITVKDIRRKFGQFNYRIINDEFFEIKVLLYKKRIGKYKAKTEFHFYKNKLFFYAYTFSYLKLEEKQEIIQILQDKYLNGESIDLIDKCIVDSENNIIIINDKVELSVYYLCNNEEALGRFVDYYKNRKKASRDFEEKHRSSLYNKL